MDQIRHRHRVTRSIRTSNCILFMTCLLLSRRIIKIVYIAKRHHFVGVTPRGTLIHFKTTTKRDDWAPYLFAGYVETIGRYRLGKHLEFTDLSSLLRFLLHGYKLNSSD